MPNKSLTALVPMLIPILTHLTRPINLISRLSECKGDLYCYERGDKGWRTNLENGYDPNPWAQVPGCTGYGKHGKNYCSKKKYESPYSDKEVEEILDKN